MAEYSRTQLWSPDGDLLWEGPYPERERCLELLQGDPCGPAMGMLCGRDPDSGEVKTTELLRTARDLELIDRVGCVPGFFNILPRGTHLDRCIDEFNSNHLRALEAVRVDFPLVFDHGSPEVKALTETYEVQGRMFRLGGADEELRLSYAADPGLFLWLRGRKLDLRRLPYAIYSPAPAFRRWKTGEVGGLDALRQYPVPDMHILCTQPDAFESYLKCVRLASEGARFWFRGEWAHFLDIDEAFAKKGSIDLGAMARASKAFTLVNYLARRPRYYAIRTGIMADGGQGPVMLYNIQWDDMNADRFGFEGAGGVPIVVVHATVLGGWPKMVPTLVGRALAGRTSRRIPAELSPYPVVCVPVNEEHVEAALAFGRRLEEVGVATRNSLPAEGGLGRRIKQLRHQWQPHHVVIGDLEAGGAEPRIESISEGASMSLDCFMDEVAPRVRRCSPPGASAFWKSLPF